MRTPIALTNSWQQVVTGAAALIVQSSSTNCELFIGVTPTAGDNGFLIESEVPYNIPNLQALGGEVWARGRGVLRSAADV